MNEFDAFQIAIYLDILYAILKECKDLSVLKLAFFSYAINKNRYFEKEVYNAHHTRDVVTKEISTISGDFDGFLNAIPYIIRSIDILKRREIFDISGNIVHIKDESFSAVYCIRLSNFEKSAIESSSSWSDRRFIQEVLHSV